MGEGRRDGLSRFLRSAAVALASGAAPLATVLGVAQAVGPGSADGWAIPAAVFAPPAQLLPCFLATWYAFSAASPGTAPRLRVWAATAASAIAIYALALSRLELSTIWDPWLLGPAGVGHAIGALAPVAVLRSRGAEARPVGG